MAAVGGDQIVKEDPSKESPNPFKNYHLNGDSVISGQSQEPLRNSQPAA
jgi:hypothetical protein